MRITNSMMLRSTMVDLRQSLSRLQTSQIQLSTGKQLQRPSDDPTASSSAMTMKNQLRRAEAEERSATDAEAWLNTADTALLTSLDVMTRIKELTVRAGNAGVSNQGTRSAIASEVRGLREELIATGNTKYLDRSVFNGTQDGAAYDDAGTYLGNDGAIRRDVAPGTTLQVNLTGEEIFGDQAAPEGDLFAVLDRLATAINSGDLAAIETEHSNFDAASDRLSSAAAEIGSRARRLENISTRAAQNLDTVRETLSQIEDVDLASALLDVQARQNSYQASLSAAARVLPPSLVDFMR